MKIEEISKHNQNEYQFVCQCLKVYTVLAQRDDDPEYYTEVYLKCVCPDCAEYVEFILPVN